ncbi:golgin subfamily A member 1-like isoform X2 [Clytia hemisphaerica]|uniref:golgin subfamily A member 1-like isoform X2 n=1 Tax=Clytia hemisphaerica TaxID=252671 RepID=UPI0034D7603E
MFHRMKQRLEDGEHQQANRRSPNTSPIPHQVMSSTPKKPSRPTPFNSRKISNAKLNTSKSSKSPKTNNNKNIGENKWEKRRLSTTASLTSSRESLYSLDSSATAPLTRVSYSGFAESSYSTIDTPSESPLIIERFREVATKDEVLSELSRKTEQVKKLEGKINEMALAYMEQTKQRDKLEESLLNLRNEMQNQSETSMTDTIQEVEEKYKRLLDEKDKKVRDILNKHEEERCRIFDANELHKLQSEEVAKMKAMLIHSQTEMSRKTAELIEKSKKIEMLDREYSEQRIQLGEMEERLGMITRDRTKFEMREKQTSMQIATLEKEKSALKSQLSDLISDVTQKSSMLETLQLSSDRAHEEFNSLRQTYNLYKAKASSELDEKNATIHNLKERVGDLEQRIKDSQLSENDQFKALEKERSLLEKRLQDTREELIELKTQSNDKITTMGSLVASLDEKQQHYENEIAKLNKQLVQEEEKSRTLNFDSKQVESLQKKVKDLETKCSVLQTEKLELEIKADKSSYLEAQNKLLDKRFKESVDRYDEDRRSQGEKLKRKIEQLETQIEDQKRIITQYREQLEELKDEKDLLNISTLQESLQQKEEIISCIRDSGESSMEQSAESSAKDISLLQELLNTREQDLMDRDDVIDEMQNVIQSRDEELAEISKQLQQFKENNKAVNFRKTKSNNEKELQSTINKLTKRINELELQQKEINDSLEAENLEIENRSLHAELDESNQKIRQLQQNLTDLKKHCQKQMNTIQKQDSNNQMLDQVELSASGDENREYLDVNFKYLKHVILKYMCSTNEQSRQLVGVIGHLLQFSSRESSIVRDCFEWKLPMEKK